MLDELRAQDWVPRSVREKAKAIERAYAKLESELGRPATDDEVAKELNVEKEEFYDMLNKSRSVSVLNIDEASTFNKNDKKLIVGLLEKVNQLIHIWRLIINTLRIKSKRELSNCLKNNDLF